MGEDDQILYEPSGTDTPEHLARLQNDANIPPQGTRADNQKDSKDSNLVKPGEIKDSERHADKAVKLSGSLDPLAQKIRQILADREGLLVITQAVASALDKDQLDKVIKEQLDKEARKENSGYEKLDEKNKDEIRRKLLENPLLQIAVLALSVEKLVNDELTRGEFGQASRILYGAHVDQINAEVTNATRELVLRNLPLPATKCPIETPIDKNTKPPQPYSPKRFRQAIANGQIESKLPNYTNANQNEAPGNEEREDLTLAEGFLKECEAKLNPAEIKALARSIGTQFKWLFEGKPPEPFMPAEEMSDKEAQDYIDRAMPVLDRMLKVNDSIRDLETLAQLNSGLVTPEFIQALRRDFGDAVTYVGNRLKIEPNYPKTLDPSLQNSRDWEDLDKGVDRVHDLLIEAKKQYDLSADPKTADNICFWGRVPEEGTDQVTKESYNYARNTYTAEKVKVKIIRPNGAEATEDRIKVSTCKQHEWSGLTRYDVGAPIVSGRATVNGEPLDTNGEIKILSPGTAIRLSKDGIIQVKAINKECDAKIKDDKGIVTNLKPGGAGLGWVDILPKYSLTSGGSPVKLSNDTRYYKLDQPVDLRTDGSLPMKLVLAERLPSEAANAQFWEFIGETVPNCVDTAFLLGGAFEGKILFSAGRKGVQYLTERAAAIATEKFLAREATEGAITATNRAAFSLITSERYAAEKVLALEATRKALASTKTSSIKRILIGGMGLAKEPIKTNGNAFGNSIGIGGLGDNIESARGLIMATDIAATGVKGWPVLGKLSERWTNVWGHANPELVKMFMGPSTFLGKAKVTNERMLALADIYFAPHAYSESRATTNRFNRALYDVDKTEREAFSEVAEHLQYHQWLPAQYKVAAQFVKQLSNEDRLYVESQLRSDANTSQLATAFLNEQTPQRDKLVAALQLLKINYKEDGSMPDKLATYKPEHGPERAITRSDVESFLLNYNVLSFNKSEDPTLGSSFERCMSKIISTTKANSVIFEQGTKEALDLPLGDSNRVAHANTLVDIFENPNSKPSDKLAAGIGLLYLGVDKTTGRAKQQLAERAGWQIKVDVKIRRDPRAFTTETEKVYRMTKEDAIAEASKLALNGKNKDELFAELSKTDDALEPIKDIVTSSEVIDYVRGQLANKNMPTAERLALMELLIQVDQINPVEKAQTCLEICKDPSLSDDEKAAAISDEKYDRLAQYLALYQSHGNTAKAREFAAKIINDENISKDVRGLMVATLDIVEKTIKETSNSEEPSKKQFAELKKQLTTLRSHWQHYQKESQPMGEDQRATANNTSSFSEFYVNSLVAKINAKESSSSEIFRAAMNLSALNEHSIVKLDDKQKELMVNTFLQAANVLGKRRNPPFVKETVLNIDGKDRELAFLAISGLSANFNNLNKEQRDSLGPKIRETMLGILNLPNAGNNTKADNIGEAQLKTHVLRHANIIFAEATDNERLSLAKSLENNINEISILGLKEKNMGGLDAESLRVAKTGMQIKLEAIQEAMQCLVQVAKADQSGKTDNKSPRVIATTLFKGLALTASSQPRDLSSKGKAADKLDKGGEADEDDDEDLKILAPIKTIDPHVRIFALQSLNALRPIDGMEELCSQILEKETNVAIREEVNSMQRLLGWKDPDSFETEYLLSKKALKDAGDSVNLKEADEYVRFYLSSFVDHDITSGKFNSDQFLGEESLEMLDYKLKNSIENLIILALEDTANGAEIGHASGKQARNALAYLMATNCNSLAEPIRAKANQLIAQGWNRVCHSTNSEVRKGAAPLAAFLMTHAPAISRANCREAAEALPALGPESKEPVLSKEEIATLLSMGLERELDRSVNNITDTHFKESQDSQLYFLGKLKPYLTKNLIPLLVAIADERRQSSLERDPTTGGVVKVNYSGGRSLRVEPKGIALGAFSFVDPNGKENRWIRDNDTKAFYTEDDLVAKKNPWYCEAQMLSDGAFVIRDAPDKLAILPRNSWDHSVETASLEDGKVGRRSPGGTLTAQYGSQTILTREGAQIVEVNLGLPGKLEGSKEKLPDGSTRDAAPDKYDIWAQVIYPDGSRLSQTCDATGRRSKIDRLKARSAAVPTDVQQTDNLLSTPPLWTRNFGVADIPALSDFGYDRNAYAFYRVDTPQPPIEKGKEIRYETRIEPSGSVVTDRLAFDQNNSSRTCLLRSAGRDDNSDHQMPLVRELARNMLAQIAEDTNSLKAEVKVSTDRSSSNTAIDTATTRLRSVVDNRKSNSEEVCKAIFAAGLVAKIREENDPRRALFNELLSNAHERVRLSAAHMLFEQSIYRQDRRAGALELANIANQGSLLGYRLDAQQTLEKAKQNIDRDRHKSDPTLRLALGLPVDEASSGTIMSVDDNCRIPLRKLLVDQRPAIRLLAATRLLNSNLPSDQNMAAKAICELAKQGETIQIRDQALSAIYSKDASDRVQEALGNKNKTKEFLLSTLASTKLMPLPNKPPAPEPVKESDRSFNERYDAVKLAILSSRGSYLNGFDPNWLTQDLDYQLLDTATRNAYIKQEAEKELGGWSIWGYEPNYNKTAIEVTYTMFQQMRGLIADAGLTPTEEEQQKKPGAAERAGIIITHLAMNERGALGQAMVRAVAEGCKGNSIAAEKMTRIAYKLISQPTLEPDMRQIVFDALKTRSAQTNSALAKAETAEAAARGLATEFLVMPKSTNDPKYLSSENLIINFLTYLKDVHYNGNSAAIKALYESSSSSQKIKTAAKEILDYTQKVNSAANNNGKLKTVAAKTKDEKLKPLPLPKLEITGSV